MGVAFPAYTYTYFFGLKSAFQQQSLEFSVADRAASFVFQQAFSPLMIGRNSLSLAVSASGRIVGHEKI